ncbi:MAG: hypothetical protein DRI36_05235, partial [Caldiserica bacterium]
YSPYPFLFAEIEKRSFYLDKNFEIDNVSFLNVIDKKRKKSISFRTSTPVTLWHFPVFHISSSERGLEKTYQGSSVTFLSKFKLRKNDLKEIHFEVE